VFLLLISSGFGSGLAGAVCANAGEAAQAARAKQVK